MKKLLLLLLISLVITGCSSPVNAATVPVRPTLVPTTTPAIETCFVDLTNAPIQIAVTGVDIQEYCTSLIEIDPTRQVLGETISTEPEVCNIEIDPGVFASVRSSSGYTDIANGLCELFSQSSATTTPQP